VIERLAPQVGALVINANQNRERYAAFGYPVISDVIPGFAGPLAGLHAGIAPSVDIVEDGEKVRVLFELPGVDAADVKVTVRGRVVTVRGNKRGRTRPREGLRFFCMERYFGTFVKSVPLPRPVNTRQAKSRLSRGLLEVVLPRVPDLREKEVEIAVKTEEDAEK
jgi:HSP20 family molecular chaperone IbpA